MLDALNQSIDEARIQKKEIEKMISVVTRILFQMFLVSAASLLPNASCEDSIYEILRAHGLPMGLFPTGITKFVVDEAGRFEVHLDQACNAKFESELHYERNVSGTLSYGQIGGLSGISAQELFLWFPVKGIRVDLPSSGLIYFDVGVVFKQFSLSLFETPRACTAVQSLESESVAKSQLMKLPYDLDQKNYRRDVM